MKKIKKILRKSFYVLLVLSIFLGQLDFTFIYAESKEKSSVEENKSSDKGVKQDQNLLEEDENDKNNSELEEKNKTQEESDENKESDKNNENLSKENINTDENDEGDIVNEIENEETDSSIFIYDESGTMITGFNGDLAKDKIVFPREHNGKTIVGIANKAFEGKGIRGELIFPDTYTEIASHAFKNNKIDSISILGKTYIGVGAFEKNNIKTLDLPRVKNIDGWAFEGNLLESANLPEVEYIGEYSFGNYPGAINKNKIEELYLPSIKEIDEKAFQGANTKVNLSGEISPNLFSYIEVDGKLKILAFKNNNLTIKGEAKFPSETNEGKPIVSIEDRAFEEKDIEGHISFPESYKEIGKWAFKGNQITSVDVKGVKLIEEGALENNNIEDLDLEGVEELGPWAFAGNSLEKVSGNKLKKIGPNAFGGTSLDLNLTGKLSPDLFSYDEDMRITGTYFPNINLTGDICFPSETNDGKSIVGIGDNAFEEKDIEAHISFPETYEEIGKWAFKNNRITSISLEGESYIGEGAFEKNKLSKLDLPKVKNIDGWAFEGNLLESVNLPKLLNIGEMAFNNNRINEELNLPLVMKIGPWAFEGNEIESLNLPEVSNVGEAAFANNKLSKELNLPNLEKLGDSAFQNNRIERLDLPKLKVIGDYGFADNKLKEVIVPKLTKLGEWALVGEEHELKSLTIDNKLESVSLSSLYMPNKEHLGNFPIYVNNLKKENIIDSEHRIVYNPSDDFKENYLGSLTNNEEYIWTSIDDFIMGIDKNNNAYYCVDHETPMKQGIYDIHDDVDIIYLIEHGEQMHKGQKVSLDKKPDSYKYSYDGALVSSIITNYYELIGEYETTIDTGRIYNIIYPVASNPDIKEQVHLTRNNFFDIVEKTDMYRNIYSYEEDNGRVEDETLKDFTEELYKRVQNDERDYSKLSYLILSDRKDNVVNLSQSLVKPGELEDPEEPGKPIIPEPEDPGKPEDPEEPDKPEDPEDPGKPEDPEEPDKPEEPEEPDKPKDPEDPEEPDKPEDPEEPEEDEDGSKNPNKPGEDDEDEDQSWKKPINPNNPGSETSDDEEGGFKLPKTGQSDNLLLLTLGIFLIFLGIKVDKKYE